MMPKSRKRNRRRNFVAIPFQSENTLGALADDGLVLAGLLSGNLTEDLFVISIDCQWSYRGHTVGEEPISVGFAHGDLSTTEVGENLAAEPLGPDSIIERERARRPVRKAATFGPQSATDVTLSDGNPIRTTIKFSVGSGHNLNQYAANRSGAVLTTGTIIIATGTIYGRWQR